MKNKLILFAGILAVASAGLAFWYFSSKQNKLFAHVPKDALVVAKVSISDLFKKMDFEKLKSHEMASDLMEKFTEQLPDFAAEIMESPDKSGIDFLVNPVIYMKPTGNKNDLLRNYQIGILLGVSNKESVKKLIENIGEDGEIEYTFKEDKEKGFMKAYPKEESNRNYAIAWNDDLLALLFSTDNRKNNRLSSRTEDILYMQDSESMKEDYGFKKFISNTADIDVYLNSKIIMEKYSTSNDIKRLKRENKEMFDLLKNLNGTSAHLAFENQAVVLNSYFYFEEGYEGKAILGPVLEKQYLKHITSNGNALGVFGASFDPKSYKYILESFSSSDDSNQKFPGQNKYTIQDVMKMFSGQIVASVTGFAQQEVTKMEMDYDSYQYKPVKRLENQPVINIQLGLTKPSKVKEFLNDYSSVNGTMTSNGEVYSMNIPNLMLLHFVVKDNILLISSDPAATNLSNKENWPEATNQEISATVLGNQMGLYLSLNKKDYELDAIPFKISENGANIFDLLNSFSMTAGIDKSSIKLTLNDGEGNSLFRLINGIFKAGNPETWFVSNSQNEEPEVTYEAPFADTTAAMEAPTEAEEYPNDITTDSDAE
jgi:hypothetical protein